MDLKIIYLRRCIFNRCPRCGFGRILKNIFYRFEKCSICDLNYSRETGFFLGGLPINYSIFVLFFFFPLGISWFLGWLSTFSVLCIGIPSSIFIPLILHRYSQCLWLGIYFTFAYSEMPETSDAIKQQLITHRSKLSSKR